VVAAALHQVYMEQVGHAPRIFRTRQERVDELDALVSGCVGEEGAGLIGCRNAAGEVQVDAAQEFRVVGWSGR
jgi:hypothetical protein